MYKKNNAKQRTVWAVLLTLLMVLSSLAISVPAARADGLTINSFTPAGDLISEDSSEVNYQINEQVDPDNVHFTWNFSNGMDSNFESNIEKIVLNNKNSGQEIHLARTISSAWDGTTVSTQDFMYTKTGGGDGSGGVRCVELILQSTSLEAGTDYTIVLAGSIAANNGNTLEKTYSWNFTTIGTAADSQCPTWQVDSVLIANPASTEAVLEWPAAQDNTAITGYKIYQGMLELALVGADTLTYTVSGLTPATSHNFKIEAGDANGNWSNDGPAVAVMTEALPVSTPPADSSPTDIAGHWAENNIKTLMGMGAMNGYADGTFKPNNKITRAEFATILVKALDLEAGDEMVFSDTANHWAREYISIAAANGIINGYSVQKFGPDDSITREQMAAMIGRARQLQAGEAGINFIDEQQISAWAREAVQQVSSNLIMSGYEDHTFRPAAYTSRAEAAKTICQIL